MLSQLSDIWCLKPLGIALWRVSDSQLYQPESTSSWRTYLCACRGDELTTRYCISFAKVKSDRCSSSFATPLSSSSLGTNFSLRGTVQWPRIKSKCTKQTLILQKFDKTNTAAIQKGRALIYSWEWDWGLPSRKEARRLFDIEEGGSNFPERIL